MLTVAIDSSVSMQARSILTLARSGIVESNEPNGPYGAKGFAEGVVTGCGKVNGRYVVVASEDFTAMAGLNGVSADFGVAVLLLAALRPDPAGTTGRSLRPGP